VSQYATINQDISVNANAYVYGNLTVSQYATINQDISVNANTYVSGNLIVSQYATVSRDISVNANTYVKGNLIVSQYATMNQDISVNANTYVKGNLIVSQYSSFYKDLSMNGVNIYTNGGNISTGTTAANSGTITAKTYTVLSDYRLKTDIKSIDLSEINTEQLNPVTYTHKYDKSTNIGLIAHELQKVFPYLVTGEKDGEEMQSVNYIGLISLLIKEVQELKTRVKHLESKI
jgi:UDP-3-O-[3-hydroxymyristoyl] glucosamine N-acyltransferase